MASPVGMIVALHLAHELTEEETRGVSQVRQEGGQESRQGCRFGAGGRRAESPVEPSCREAGESGAERIAEPNEEFREAQSRSGALGGVGDWSRSGEAETARLSDLARRARMREPSQSASEHLAICGATDVGAARANNQDTFVIADLRTGDLSNPCSRAEIPLSPQGILLLVCDGMGGAAAGDIAARIAAEAIKRQLVGAGPATTEHPDESLKSAVWGANGAVLAEAKAHPETRGMGTTCTAAIVLPDRLVIAQVGDSRAYLLRDDRLYLLTRDQTVAEQMVDSGALRPEDVGTFAYSHILVQAVGTRSTIEPITSDVLLCRGDRILLCSDGLHGPVPDSEIARTLGGHPDINVVAHELIQAALAAGGPDNVTVVVADRE
jgi:PPM family protein phosphatase